MKKVVNKKVYPIYKAETPEKAVVNKFERDEDKVQITGYYNSWIKDGLVSLADDHGVSLTSYLSVLFSKHLKEEGIVRPKQDN